MSITRAYQNRIVETPEVTKLLRSTYDIYNKGADYFLSFWKQLCGDFCPESPSFCLSFWFTLETENNQKYIISADEVKKKFNYYWWQLKRKEVSSPELTCFFDTILDCQRKGTVWVDQRQAFFDANKILNIEPEYIDHIFTRANFAKENSEGTIKQLTKSLVSEWWGNGKASDWERMNESYKKIHTFFKNQSPKSSKQLLEETLAHFKQKDVLTLKKDMFSSEDGNVKSGRTDSVITFLLYLESKDNFPVEKKAIDEYLKKIESKMSTQHFPRSPWMAFILDDFEKTLKFKFRQNKDLSCQVSNMFSMAVQRHRSYHSNFTNHLVDRVTRFQEKETAMSNYNSISAIDEAFESVLVPGQKYFSLAQFRGKQKFIRKYENCFAKKEQMSITDIKKDLGDSNMFGVLATTLNRENIKPKDMENSLNKFIDLQETFRKYFGFKSHCLTSFAKASNHPWFGNQKGKFDVKLGKESAVIELFDGIGFKDVFIEIRGKRFKEEIYYHENKEGLEISRDSKLVRKDVGYEVPVKMDISKASAQIVPLVKGWYLNISVELSDPKVTMKEYALKFKNEGSILGIDLGRRTAVSYAHLKQSDQGTVTIENDKSKAEKCKFNVVEVGSLNESFLVRRNKKTVGKANHFKHICRLSYRNRDAGDNEKQIWLEVRKMCVDIGIELPEREAPVSAMKLYEDIVYYTKRYVRQTKKWDETYTFLGQLYYKLLNSRIGGLSFAWISLLMSLKSCFQCFVRRANDNNQNINFDNVILVLTEKANNVRRERARISANLIVQKAIEIKKVEGRNPMIVIEKLDIRPSQSNTSFLNERTHNWCSRRIVDLVKQLSEEFGFVVKEVNPRNSSMEDVKTGEWKPRFDIVNVNDLEKKYHYNFLANTFLKPNGQREMARRSAVLNKLNYLKVEPNVDNLILVLKKEAIDGKVYSPSVFGQWYYSDVWGWIDSDQHAAIILASRGAKLLFGWYRERQDIENAEDAKKSHKSLCSNGVMAKNGTDGRSQDVSLLAKTSWGKMNEAMKKLEEKEWSPARKV